MSRTDEELFMVVESRFEKKIGLWVEINSTYVVDAEYLPQFKEYWLHEDFMEYEEHCEYQHEHKDISDWHAFICDREFFPAGEPIASNEDGAFRVREDPLSCHGNVRKILVSYHAIVFKKPEDEAGEDVVVDLTGDDDDDDPVS